MAKARLFDFLDDVLISHSPRDTKRARELSKIVKGRNKDITVLLTSDVANTADELHDALNRSRTLALLLSHNGTGSPLLAPEEQARPFLDPNDPDRRFSLIRLDSVALPKTLETVTPFDLWKILNPRELDRLYDLLALQPRPMRTALMLPLQVVLRGHSIAVNDVSLSADGRRAVSGGGDGTVRVWDLEGRSCLASLEGHKGVILSVSISADGRRAVSGGVDGTVRVWDLEGHTCLAALEGHDDFVRSVSISADGRRAVSGGVDGTVRVWDPEGRTCLATLRGHKGVVLSASISADGQRAVSGSSDRSVRVWDLEGNFWLDTFEGHKDYVRSVSLSADGRRAVSGSDDGTLRLWDIKSFVCVASLEGHMGRVNCVALSAASRRVTSCGQDGTVRVWDLVARSCLAILGGHTGPVLGVALSADGRRAVSGGEDGTVRVWDLSDLTAGKAPPTAIYASAKVLLTGNSGVGKSGLAQWMVHEKLIPTISTDGVWATILPLPQTAKLPDGVEREVWLWDFAGQADYRLIHQLYMDGTDVALLVFNPQDDDPYEGLAEWDRAITRATGGRPFAKLLVAGRVDRGGLRVSGEAMKAFAAQRGFQGYHETSAATDQGCAGLRQAILDAIPWDKLPDTASPAVFRRIKEEVIELKDEGRRVLQRLGELESVLKTRMPDNPFTPDELSMVVRLLAGAGVIWLLPYEERENFLEADRAKLCDLPRSSFEWVLLQPERINSYAAAVVREVKKHPLEIGSITEDTAMGAQYEIPPETKLPRTEEEIVLREMLRTMIARGICLREHTSGGTQLVFPAFFRRERPTLPEHPPAFVSYRFQGMLDEVYTTLVVRLHHTEAFEKDKLYKDAADFKTPGSKLRAGLKLTRLPDSCGEITVYLDPTIPIDVKVTFMKFVDDHLNTEQRATDVVRTRYYVCGACGFSVEGHQIVRKKLQEGKRSVRCQNCDEFVLLLDEIENRFGSPEIREKARAWERQAQAEISSQSKELIMKSEVGAIVGQADQIFRTVLEQDVGIDAEIEFKDAEGNPAGRRLYLQLKAGDSYLRVRKMDSVDIFDIKDPRWSEYWQQQAHPVMLVVRSSNGVIRWMDVSAVLKQRTLRGETNIRSVEFRAEPFTVENLLKKRTQALQ